MISIPWKFRNNVDIKMIVGIAHFQANLCANVPFDMVGTMWRMHMLKWDLNGVTRYRKHTKRIELLWICLFVKNAKAQQTDGWEREPNVTQWHMKVIYPSDNDVAFIYVRCKTIHTTINHSIFGLVQLVCSWEGAAIYIVCVGSLRSMLWNVQRNRNDDAHQRIAHCEKRKQTARMNCCFAFFFISFASRWLLT